MAEGTAPTCSSCDWWEAPKPVPAGSPSRAALGLSDQGECTRFPRRALKGAADCCGEHPVHVAARNRELATRLAGLIAPPPLKSIEATVMPQGRGRR